MMELSFAFKNMIPIIKFIISPIGFLQSVNLVNMAQDMILYNRDF